jgi:hypothetical protein
MRQGRLIVILLGLFIFVVIAWQVALLVSRQGLVRLEVVAVPSDSTITLDGNSIQAGSIYVSQGKHLLKASRVYFSPATVSVNTVDLGDTNTVYLLPDPSSPAAISWLEEHPEEQLQREAYGGVQENKTQQVLTKASPIIKKLPAYNFRYRIDYSIASNNHLAFKITLYPSGSKDSAEYKQQLQTYRDEALSYLKSNGVDPAKQSISYSPTL